MPRKPAKTIQLAETAKTEEEKLLDVRRTIAEGVAAIAIPTRATRKRPVKGRVVVVLK
jgi:hypothetical protein